MKGLGFTDKDTDEVKGKLNYLVFVLLKGCESCFVVGVGTIYIKQAEHDFYQPRDRELSHNELL